MQRFKTADFPCPICSGYDRAQRGQGVRCYGYLSSDGLYAHCTNDALRGDLAQHVGKQGGETYPHKLEGRCRCGVTHREALQDRRSQVRPIGESSKAEIVATYDYCDEHGTLIYQVVRKQPKAFLQRRPDDRGGWIWGLGGVAPLLYRLPELIEAVRAGDPVWIVEGERDANSLHALGQVATCNSGGAGKFPAAMARHLFGAAVTIVQDADEAGRKHAQDVLEKLKGHAKSVVIVEARVGKDATDHLSAGCDLSEFVPVYPDPDPQTHPVEWKRKILRTSLEVERAFAEQQSVAEVTRKPSSPGWQSGISGPTELSHFTGLTFVAGGPGAAKSYLAIASSLSAALYGDWEVFYLNAEMSLEIVAKRVMARLGMEPPEHWHLIDVGFGASLDKLIELLCGRVTQKNTLVVFDSISSFVDQGISVDPNAKDAWGMGELKRLCMWMVNVRKRSQGRISFLALSELNSNGQTRGKFADHKADIVLKMESDPMDNAFKTIELIKGWNAQVGSRTRCLLDWQQATLTVT